VHILKLGQKHRAVSALRSESLSLLWWSAAGSVLVAAALLAAIASDRFSYAYDVAEMPVLGLAAGLVVAGAAFAISVPWLCLQTQASQGATPRRLLAVMIAAGLAARVILAFSEPMLEDDYQRYLWDGAVTAHGHNPYTLAPATAQAMGSRTSIGRLSVASGVVAPRINHPDLRTVYPPVSQAAFALAHLIQPWSLLAWRAVLVACDTVTLALLIGLLTSIGRSPLWAALYWWHPVVLKEVHNSAHMEGLLFPFLIGAIWLAARRRYVSASALLALATGVKLWPAVLLPILLRPIVANWRRALPAVMVFAAIVTVSLAPMLLYGLGEGSGLVAYAERWKTASALTPTLEALVRSIAGSALGDGQLVPLVTRSLLALALGGGILAIARRPYDEPQSLLNRCALGVALLVLLSPAQYPWYTIWFAPFLVFIPLTGFLVLAITVPLYYLFFHFAAEGRPEVFRSYVVWVIWLPVWAALAWQAWVSAQRPKTGTA
jgi:hypothetical protein